MTIQPSFTGPISISDINVEKGLTGSTANSSLTTLSTTDINSASTYKPDMAAPHGIGEFYGYDHNAVATDCYSVFLTVGSPDTAVYWTDYNGVARSGTVSSGSTTYICSRTTPATSPPGGANLVVTPSGNACTQVHTSITDANSNPCPF